MESSIKHCIINVGVNGWYPKGSERLEKSLIYHGFNGDILTWKGVYPPGSPTHEQYPYASKIYAFEYAISQGYTRILWLDCSVWAVKDPNPIFDIINETGYYLWDSGFPVYKTCNDACLEWFGVTRDEAQEQNIKDISTSMVGINLDNPAGADFYALWKGSMLAGCFRGSRTHNPAESSDPRFLFHRQDQSAASLAANRYGLHIHEPQVYSSYYQTKMPESVIFTMRGM